MSQPWNIWVMGGDRRQLALARALAEDGHTVHTYALERGDAPRLAGAAPEEAGAAHCVILPLPVMTGNYLTAPLSSLRLSAERVLSYFTPGTLVCGGRISPLFRSLAEERRLTLIDYFAREELAVANAVPTGEGAIQTALEELPITLHGARVLILGYGRLGRVLARQLKGLGSRVTVAARSPAARAWAGAEGCCTGSTDRLADWLCGYDLILNTVPALLLGRSELERLKPGCLVIDLASDPGGVDFSAAAELGVRVIWALSLPGKTAPVTSGLAIRDTIYNILREQGV